MTSERGVEPRWGSASGTDTTQLLRDWSAGDDGAFAAVFPRVYEELKSIAHHRLRRHRPGDTLNTTVLVHEAYLKLVNVGEKRATDRPYFLAVASRAMRHILVDHARARSTQKRGGGHRPVSLDDVQVGVSAQASEDLITLNDALERLSGLDPRLGRVVEYRYFGQMEYEEIAQATGLSVPTVKRDWARARAWLYEFMTDELDESALESPDSP